MIHAFEEGLREGFWIRQHLVEVELRDLRVPVRTVVEFHPGAQGERQFAVVLPPLPGLRQRGDEFVLARRGVNEAVAQERVEHQAAAGVARHNRVEGLDAGAHRGDVGAAALDVRRRFRRPGARGTSGTRGARCGRRGRARGRGGRPAHRRARRSRCGCARRRGRRTPAAARGERRRSRRCRNGGEKSAPGQSPRRPHLEPPMKCRACRWDSCEVIMDHA
jgi:hypothetical protein